MKEKEEYRISGRRFLVIALGLVSCLAIVSFYLKQINAYKDKVLPEVTLEAGDSIDLSLFTDDTGVKPSIDLQSIDTKVPGTYPIPFVFDNRRYESTLYIRDTVPPEGEVKDLVTDVEILPDVSEFVVSSSDITGVTYKFNETPDVSVGGNRKGSIIFTDGAGNTTVRDINVLVIDDFDAPRIYGVHDIEVYTNDKVKYRQDIKLVDDKDPNPKLEIDNSKVDITKPGEYKVIYTATDATGNTRRATGTVIVNERPEGYVEPEEVYALAQKVLDKITDDSMTDMEKCFKIYFWCRENINYLGTSTKTHWTAGAYEGFTELAGDCYTYAVCAKAMFDVLGIDNRLVERQDIITTTHFWNMLYIEGGWYFFDASRSNSTLNAFLLTEEELEALIPVHGPRYRYDHTGLPTASHESIQNRIDYVRRVIKPADEV